MVSESNKQRLRWLYFVREYLQPIKSKQRENTITIIASHGNILTTFDHIIKQFIARNEPPESFPSFRLSVGLNLAHAETLLYRSIGAQPIYFKHNFIMNEIPITVNHGQLRKDFYYEWAAMHQCRVSKNNCRILTIFEVQIKFLFAFYFKSDHGREEMMNYVRSATLDNIFGEGRFQNRMHEYEVIVYLEMLDEYDTHILPMLMDACRNYLYRLPLIQANTDFGAFTRVIPPIPIPETEEEQRSPLNISFHQFSAYGMPFPVDNTIQKFRKDPYMTRKRLPRGSVHPESRILLFLLRNDK